ncbi:MAG: CDP-glycerol glycerophosphotransferase family protein, partial [Gammaproteobacteria bacterium]|nr:CDP-glycerol glycerophosphotransferase family protein [Gammaproteobacteria bacterium]
NLCAAALRLKPDDVFYRSAAESLGAEADHGQSPDCPPAALRVGFHLNKPFHFSILHPIFAALRPHHPVRLTGEPALLRDFAPLVVVVADVQARPLRTLLPQAIFVYVRHGLTSKNHLVNAAGACDFFAGVTSDEIAGMIVRANGFRPEQIWVTGHVPLDPLFSGAPLPLPISLNPENKTILFAPTWNRQLSAADLTRERTVELLRGGREDVNVIIKPHPHTIRLWPDWHRAFQRVARERPNVWLVDDPASDVVPFLSAADVLVSDVSSVIFSYLALDRPIVLVTHPERAQDHGYDPEGIEWQWRDLGEEVTEIERLPAAVARTLADPDRFAARRAHYRELLFGDLTDGRAAERIAEKIRELGKLGVRPLAKN